MKDRYQTILDGVHITYVSGLFVVVVASTGVLALVPWGVRGLYEAPAIEHTACPSTMGGEPPRAIQHPAVICLVSLCRDQSPLERRSDLLMSFILFSEPPRGGMGLVTNRKGAI